MVPQDYKYIPFLFIDSTLHFRSMYILCLCVYYTTPSSGTNIYQSFKFGRYARFVFNSSLSISPQLSHSPLLLSSLSHSSISLSPLTHTHSFPIFLLMCLSHSFIQHKHEILNNFVFFLTAHSFKSKNIWICEIIQCLQITFIYLFILAVYTWC